MDNKSFLAPLAFVGDLQAGQKIICVDDKAKPENIPLNCWVKEGDLYTIKFICIRIGATGERVLSFMLEEISLPKFCFPHDSYSSLRFKPL